MARTVLDVFLSSTAKDLTIYRDAVYARLAKIEFFRRVRMEDFGAQDAQAVAFCREKAAKADLFVGLIGMRRGWEPDGENAKRSITEIECDTAKDSGRRRFLWITQEDFPVAANLREPDALHERQLAFRARVMAGGERIVSQKGFDSPIALASEIVEQLLIHVFTSDLIRHVRPEFTNQGGDLLEEQAPAVAAAIERLAADQDVDLLALARNPKGVDLAHLEGKLKARAEACEAAGSREIRASAEYWRHIGALTFLHNTPKALAAYEKAVALDPSDPEAWRYLGELQYRLGNLAAGEQSFASLAALGQRTGDKRAEAMGHMRLGWIQRTHGDLGDAAKTNIRALHLAEADAWTEGMARAYGNLGVIHVRRGDLAKAEEMYLKSLKLEEELGRKEGMAITYGNLGIIHQTRGDLAKAEEMYLKSLKLNEQLGRKEGMANTNWNLGVIYDQTSDKMRTCKCWRKTRDLWREMGLADKAADAERWLKLRGCSEA